MAGEKKTEIKLGTPLEFKLITDEGRFRDILIIPYTIGDHHYEVRINKEGATPESIEKAVTEDARTIIDSTGKTLTV